MKLKQTLISIMLCFKSSFFKSALWVIISCPSSRTATAFGLVELLFKALEVSRPEAGWLEVSLKSFLIGREFEESINGDRLIDAYFVAHSVWLCRIGM
jgi:hypothetical protein